MDLLREWGVPPWFRSTVPVLYWEGAAVALGDTAMEPGLKTWLAEHNAQLQWNPHDPLLRKLKSVCVQAGERNNMQHG